jgi:hypothetical protein
MVILTASLLLLSLFCLGHDVMGQQCPPMMLTEYFLSFSNHTHVFVMVAFAAIAWKKRYYQVGLVNVDKV